MRTQCNPESMLFARLDRRDLVADFGGGAITSDAGALLLGATDKAIKLVDRFAACFTDGRTAGRVVHDVRTLVGQRSVRHRPRLRGSERPRRICVAIRCSGLFSAGWRRAGRGARRWPARAR